MFEPAHYAEAEECPGIMHHPTPYMYSRIEAERGGPGRCYSTPPGVVYFTEMPSLQAYMGVSGYTVFHLSCSEMCVAALIPTAKDTAEAGCLAKRQGSWQVWKPQQVEFTPPPILEP